MTWAATLNSQWALSCTLYYYHFFLHAKWNWGLHVNVLLLGLVRVTAGMWKVQKKTKHIAATPERCRRAGCAHQSCCLRGRRWWKGHEELLPFAAHKYSNVRKWHRLDWQHHGGGNDVPRGLQGMALAVEKGRGEAVRASEGQTVTWANVAVGKAGAKPNNYFQAQVTGASSEPKVNQWLFFWKALPQNATIWFLKQNQINSLWMQPHKAKSIARKQRSLLPKYEQSVCAQESTPMKHLVICTLQNDKLNYGAVCVLSQLHKTSLSIFRKDCFQSSRASNVQIKLLNSSHLLNTGKHLWTT